MNKNFRFCNSLPPFVPQILADAEYYTGIYVQFPTDLLGNLIGRLRFPGDDGTHPRRADIQQCLLDSNYRYYFCIPILLILIGSNLSCAFPLRDFHDLVIIKITILLR